MNEKIVTLDERGRIILPKEIREKVNARKLKVKLVKESILLQPVDDAVDRFYGIFKGKVEKDVDEIFNEAVEERINEKVLRR
ncbi:AbrB/MazE/SpoVT family DNA-binding domain-containing protein [Sulfurisphaera javensis]